MILTGKLVARSVHDRDRYRDEFWECVAGLLDEAETALRLSDDYHADPDRATAEILRDLGRACYAAWEQHNHAEWVLDGAAKR